MTSKKVHVRFQKIVESLNSDKFLYILHAGKKSINVFDEQILVILHIKFLFKRSLTALFRFQKSNHHVHVPSKSEYHLWIVPH